MAQQPRQPQRTPAKQPPQQQPRQEVATRRPDPITVIVNDLERFAPRILSSLPEHIPAERMKRVFVIAIKKNTELLECQPDSLWNALSEAASDGLLPDGRQGAMVVRKVKGNKVAKWQPMVEGIRIKARNSGEVLSWETSVVYEKDDFDFAKGDNPFISHKPFKGFEHGEWIAVYSIARLKNGEVLRDVMWREEVEQIRDKYSDGWKAFKAKIIRSTPWDSAPEEMARKTIVHRHRKEIPLSTDLMGLLERDMEADRRTDEDAPILEHKPVKQLTSGNGEAKPSALDRFVEEEEAGENDTTSEAEDDPEDTPIEEASGGVVHDVNPETGEIIEPDELTQAINAGADDGSPAQAYIDGRAAREAGKPRIVPEKYRKDQPRGSAWVEGWMGRDDEITKAARAKAGDRG